MDCNTPSTHNSAAVEAAVASLMAYLDASPVNFLAVKEAERRLQAAGFSRLDPREAWTIRPGDRRYIVKNDSALMAFVAGQPSPEPFRIISAHTDSPGFRVKPNAAMAVDGDVVKLNTEVYGGPILYTWFDRPLSLAGRVVVRGDSPMWPRHLMVRFNRPLLTIPHLAIHFNRAVNEGNPISRQTDMLPVIGVIHDHLAHPVALRRLLAEELDIEPDTILDWDLGLYDTTPACRLGLEGELVSSGRLDDLSMVCAGLDAITSPEALADAPFTRVLALFDNEETGSGTKQGAASPMLDALLRRINACLGNDEETYLRRIAGSFMISADNAHAIHPNHPEKHDPTNHPVVNGGPVIKINANCKYMTDADSAAVYAEICREAGVEVQYFVNRSDSPGGSTLGNILTSQIDLRGVDMGSPIWAMHSCRETGGTADQLAALLSFRRFWTK